MDTAGLDDMNQQSGGSKAVSALARAGMPLQSLPPTHSYIAFGICNSSEWRDSMMAQKSADVCILAEKNDIWRILRKISFFGYRFSTSHVYY